MFGPYDLYEDLVFPGGIYHDFYLREWQNLNEVLDKDKPPVSSLLIKTAVKGVARIKREKPRFRQALQDHRSNVNVHAQARTLTYRDDPIVALGLESIDEISPHTMLEGSTIPTYAYSGWYDGGYQHAAIRRFLNSENEDSRLTIGPWDHGGGNNASPSSPGKAGFTHLSEVLRFFDIHLKDGRGTIDTSSRIHYFTQLADEWQVADSWPPKGFTNTKFYLGVKSLNSKTAEDGVVQIEIDSASSTGSVTRWEALAAASATPPLYPDRKERDSKLTIFETSVFDKNMELTGHPIVRLDLEESDSDVALIAYLELVDPHGEVTYMTEGRMFGIHASSRQQNMYHDAVAQPTYNRRDDQNSLEDASSQFYLDLLPTSFIIPARSKIRLALATADAAHFRFLNKGKDFINILCGENSFLEVPLKKCSLPFLKPK